MTSDSGSVERCRESDPEYDLGGKGDTGDDEDDFRKRKKNRLAGYQLPNISIAGAVAAATPRVDQYLMAR